MKPQTPMFALAAVAALTFGAACSTTPTTASKSDCATSCSSSAESDCSSTTLVATESDCSSGACSTSKTQ